jgi:integrase
MSRSIYSTQLRNRTARLRLPVRKKPYRTLLAPGVFLAYRRCVGPGSWSAEAGWLRRFALADDREDANGGSVMSYHQAAAHALKLARGTEGGDADVPVSVAAALDSYATDLAVRGGGKSNATSVRIHLSPAMLAKAVMLLTEAELAAWRNGLVAEGLKLSSANRIGKSFKAALALAAKHDKRIANSSAWKNGLKPLKVKGHNAPPRDHYYLPDGTIRAIVAECYLEDPDFGDLIATLAGTGTRESQALKLRPQDLRDDDAAPRLMLWCSAKGRDRDPEQRSVPITLQLAKMLRARAIARGSSQPLFNRIWNMSLRFRVVLERLGLDLSLSPYVLRHSSIIRQIRSNTPMRIIAYTHDTSTIELERTYARYLGDASEDARSGLLDDAVMPMADNVVTLGRQV